MTNDENPYGEQNNFGEVIGPVRLTENASKANKPKRRTKTLLVFRGLALVLGIFMFVSSVWVFLTPPRQTFLLRLLPLCSGCLLGSSFVFAALTDRWFNYNLIWKSSTPDEE